MSPRIVAYLPNFEQPTGFYKGVKYGTLQNYTHVIFGFMVAYKNLTQYTNNFLTENRNYTILFYQK